MNATAAYTYDVAYKQLEKSGLAAKIMASKGDFEIDLRQLRQCTTDKKHQNTNANDAHYFRFLQNSIRSVMDLVSDNTSRYIEITSKKLIIPEPGVKMFSRGWTYIRMIRGP